MIKGNLIDALIDKKIYVLAHGCNCSNGFGSGLAKEIANRLPEVKEQFHENHTRNMDKLGNVDYITTNGLHVANCYTQQTYGRDKSKIYVDYDAIDACVTNLAKRFSGVYVTVGFPKIGCGLAGGDWGKVHKIIKERFEEHNAHFEIYVLEDKNEM